MNKPKNYEYYRNSRNKIPYKKWPKKVKEYFNWERRNRMKPEWKDLSSEERKKEQLKVIAENRKKWHEKWNNMSDEDRSVINKKKGNFWNNASEEQQEEIRYALTERSQNFWDAMTTKERIEFGQYRWNLKSDDEKSEIIERFIKGGKLYIDNLSQDDIMNQIDTMNKARLNKMQTDPEFRNKQIHSLRYSCLNYWDSLDNEDKARIIRNRIISANGENKLHQKFEKCFKSSYLDKNFNILPEQYILIDGMNKVWDYGVYSKESNELVMLIDLDGAFYHGDNCDYNGSHGQEEYDERRYQIVPNNIKLHIIYELKFEESFKSMTEVLILSYDKFIDSQFKICRSLQNIPYPSYTDIELAKSYNQLLRMDCDSKYVTNSTNTRIGDRLINHFHHSIYSANRRGEISPYEAWYNDKLLKDVIRNRMIYINTINPNKILQGFNIAKIAPKVSVFSAGRAKLLIYKYLNTMNEIFDPFSGFSGRMLGTISLGKRYIGQDISEIHINESIRIIEFLKSVGISPEVYLQQQNILQSNEEYECLFTCPPYADKEQWLDVKSDKKSCDDWIYECLSRFKCKKYLFVVDNTEKYKDYIVDEIINKSHFGSNKEYVILIKRED